MLVKKLQESWPNVRQAIEELEKEDKIFVFRTGGNSEREGQMKMVYWNELGPVTKVDQGGSKDRRLDEMSSSSADRLSIHPQSSTRCGIPSNYLISSPSLVNWKRASFDQ